LCADSKNIQSINGLRNIVENEDALWVIPKGWKKANKIAIQ
jgi:hypothetical protein